MPSHPVAHMVPGGYGDRAWTRLEAFTFYVLSILRGRQQPDLYVIGTEGSILRIDYDLLPNAMPASGELTCDDDREHIQLHQGTLLSALRRRALKEATCESLQTQRVAVVSCRGCIGPALTMLGALGDDHGISQLLDLKVNVDATDNRGYTALISAARYDHADAVQMLLAAGANVDCANSFGWTPLIMCARKGNSEI